MLPSTASRSDRSFAIFERVAARLAARARAKQPNANGRIYPRSLWLRVINLPHGPHGPIGSPGPVGPPGLSYTLGDWVWAADYAFRSVVCGKIVGLGPNPKQPPHYTTPFVILELERPLPYFGERLRKQIRVSPEKLVKPHLLERVAFAASDDANLLQFKKGKRIRFNRQSLRKATGF